MYVDSNITFIHCISHLSVLDPLVFDSGGADWEEVNARRMVKHETKGTSMAGASRPQVHMTMHLFLEMEFFSDMHFLGYSVS